MNATLSQPLLYKTSDAWLNAVLADFDTFLADHASAEKKASGMAINMISHYPDRKELVSTMAELAIEELNHYREVIKLIHDSGKQLQDDQKDPYVVNFRKQALRNGSDEYLMDQLLLAGIVEARGAERFGLIAEGLDEGKLKRFYKAITKSEERHHEVFFELALSYFPETAVLKRIQELAEIEAKICAELTIRPALH